MIKNKRIFSLPCDREREAELSSEVREKLQNKKPGPLKTRSLPVYDRMRLRVLASQFEGGGTLGFSRLIQAGRFVVKFTRRK